MALVILSCGAITCPFLIIKAYKIKCKLNIDLLKGEHTPDLLEKYSKGLIKSDWFNN